MPRAPLLLFAMLALLVAGCASPPDAPTGDAPPRAPVEEEPSPPAAEGGTRASPAAGGAGDAAGWPPLDEAPIRPGVRLGELHAGPEGVGGRLCTGNFVFRSPDNASLYLGTAAHCVKGMQPGDEVAIEGVGGRAGATGTLAYSSFVAMNASLDGLPRLSEDEGGAPSVDNNDFALVRIDDAFRHLVHPATLHFGGPTGIADANDTRAGTRILLYGSSGAKRDVEPLSLQAGCVVRPGPRATRIHVDVPGVPGDSGGPVLLADGRALGVMTHTGTGVATEAPFLRGGTNFATNLDAALDYARASSGIEVELVTWPTLEGAPLPETPCPAPPG